MNKIRIFAFTAALTVSLSAMTVFIRGDEKTYDPENDPLISLSYLNGVFAPTYDSKIESLKAENTALSEKITSLEETLTSLEGKMTEHEGKITHLEVTLAELLNDMEEEPETDALGGYEVLCLYEGEKLLAKSPCELILRSGSAITVSITSNGVNDLTDGAELMNADNIPLYHQLLVPRGNDGRGLQVTSPEAYIMVRGDYEIVK